MNRDDAETRRALLAEVDVLVNKYAAKRDREWSRNMERAAMKFEAGKNYRISQDGTVSEADPTTPSLQLFSSKSQIVATNATHEVRSVSEVETDLKKMRERVGMSNPSPATPDQETLEKIIYEVRDEWCSDTGEWDATKMPVPELAKRLAGKLSPW